MWAAVGLFMIGLLGIPLALCIGPIGAFEALKRSAVFPRLTRPRFVLISAILKLCAAAILLSSYWTTKAAAEGRVGWRDDDDNGMLDPMVNGAYDYMDLVLSQWVELFLTVWFSTLTILTVAHLGLMAADARDRSRRPVDSKKADKLPPPAAEPQILRISPP